MSSRLPNRADSGHFRQGRRTNFELAVVLLLRFRPAGHKFAYYTTRDSTHRSRCGSARSGRQRIQLGLRRPCKNIRSGINRRCLPACLPGSADALAARRFPVREPTYIMRTGIEDQLYALSSRGLFPRA